jgi:hypothetical protein
MCPSLMHAGCNSSNTDNGIELGLEFQQQQTHTLTTIVVYSMRAPMGFT